MSEPFVFPLLELENLLRNTNLSVEQAQEITQDDPELIQELVRCIQGSNGDVETIIQFLAERSDRAKKKLNENRKQKQAKRLNSNRRKKPKT